MKDYYFDIPQDTDITTLKELISKCENEILFESDEGDRIALKSTLGQLIFFMIFCNQELLDQNPRIHCIGEHDQSLLNSILIPRTF